MNRRSVLMNSEGTMRKARRGIGSRRSAWTKVPRPQAACATPTTFEGIETMPEPMPQGLCPHGVTTTSKWPTWQQNAKALRVAQLMRRPADLRKQRCHGWNTDQTRIPFRVPSVFNPWPQTFIRVICVIRGFRPTCILIARNPVLMPQLSCQVQFARKNTRRLV